MRRGGPSANVRRDSISRRWKRLCSRRASRLVQRYMIALAPPSTTMFAPVTQAASSDAR
jgi:hypothetical protein